ncbi:YaaR family protein [Mahella australiensis]|uniref:DUF327 domain-containing protein n=1 Tax=Mahella australiensis (strain DSM 15567 / CIP 107919 / 50-1 BON) TaxID=697281 RepID=F3ZXS7_MAHA5|nr:YaaR family protein [Mahella australiensis]AEE95584.1 protein of unknown function DUF327 [Mahella australiensis 50-1 BON]
MKVNDIRGGYAYNSQPSDAVHIDKNAPGGAFSQAFGNAAGRDAKEWLNGMLSDIKVQGQRLEKNTDLAGLLHYRRTIAIFLNAVTSSMLQFSTSEVVDKRGRRKRYTIIKRIDEQLELLTEQVMMDETDHIAILKLIGEIEGLLVDLLA